MKLSGKRLAAVVVGAAVAVGSGAALVATMGGDDGAKDKAGSVDEQASDARDKGKGDRPGTTSTVPAGPDPLCVAHDERAAVSAAIGAVDDAAENQTRVQAQLDFYTTASALVDEPYAAAFQRIQGWYDAQRAFYEPRGWNPQVDFSEVDSVPQPPRDGSIELEREILSERCGVSFTTEAPTP
jgi:hypothetical protein